MEKRRLFIYWIATIVLALGMLSGGVAQLLRAKGTVDGFAHLGYPSYLLSILGTWKVLGVIVLLLPKFTLVKEWAYAGFFFAMSGAAISHIVSGDLIQNAIAPFVFLILIVISWYCRPTNRRIAITNL